MSGMTYNQDGLLSDLNPGSRVKELLNRDGADLGQSTDVIPSNPGPAALNRTPVVGSVRRSQDMPVLRDELQDMMN